jgi:hypothetical protein
MRRETVFNRVWTRFVCETAFQRIDFAFRVYMGSVKYVHKQTGNLYFDLRKIKKKEVTVWSLYS